MSGIPWKLPGPDTPGFLRRRGDLIKLLDAEPDVDSHEHIVDALIPYVDLPEDEAREALMDCSQMEYGRAVMKLLGYGFKIPDPKGGRSGPL